MSEDATTIKDLRDDANETARHVRNQYVFFLLICAYVVVTVGANSHEDLLVGVSLRLPLVNVDLPISPFYIIVPLLVVLLHHADIGRGRRWGDCSTNGSGVSSKR